MWGSPVIGSQTLKNFSPATQNSRFYRYNSETDLFNAISPSTVFSPGEGYLIRMPDNHISYSPSAIPVSFDGTFTGVPTNGPVNVILDLAGDGFNMVSNPYPSTLDATKFLEANENEIGGTIYFWRRRNNQVKPLEDESSYYATYTSAGGVAVNGAQTNMPKEIPNGSIQIGQGFLVSKSSITNTGNIKFTNDMRTMNNVGQIFRIAETTESSRIWLNVTNTAGEFGQMLVAYMPTATNGVDRSDGKFLGDGKTALTSWLDDKEYIIQGRASFNSSDVVPLNFRTANQGIYTIAIDHVDGLFEEGQDIFLRDKFEGVTHNLKSAAYIFATAAGSFSDRFEMVYAKGTLVVDNPAFDSNSIVMYKKDGDLVVLSKSNLLDEIEVFDFAGRLLAKVKNIKSKEVAIKMNDVNQVLIIKIRTAEGKIISKKMIN